ncbi:TetR/AcrR family transcriptional regulator [Leekyejoonella antrihumi]|uniref:TetR/AcrR family transcriptional regulator n=1 Tax=Leekyejoonella antrihumi TaxID=1660198 RepID=UPI001C946E84|nr:TetR family transcriptional regulator [Leekyejoonella antrihumi]
MTETAEPTEGLRERKKRATRDALRTVALEATLERGLRAVTVEEIAAAANVSVRTFFNYFSTKEEAVVGFDPEQPARIRDAVIARPAGEEPVAALRAVLLEHAGQISVDSSDWGDRLQAIKDNPELLAAHLTAWSSMETALAEAIATRTGLDADRDLYPTLVASAVAMANRVAIRRWKSGPAADLPALVTEAVDLLASGLHPPAP